MTSDRALVPTSRAPARAVPPRSGRSAPERTPRVAHAPTIRPADLPSLQRDAGNAASAALIQVQREWDLAAYQKTYPANYAELLALCGPTGRRTKAKTIERLTTLARHTDSSDQLTRLLGLLTREDRTAAGTADALIGLLTQMPATELIAYLGPKSEATAVEALLTPDSGGLRGLQERLTGLPHGGNVKGLLRLDTDVAALRQLHEVVGGLFLSLLQHTPQVPGGRARFILGTIADAGGLEQLKTLSALSLDVGVLAQMLTYATFAELQPIVVKYPQALRGKGLEHLLPFGRPADAADLLAREAGRSSIAELKVRLSSESLAAQYLGPKAHPKAIRFTQAHISGFGEGYSVKDNIKRLRDEPTWMIPGGPIRVFVKRRQHVAHAGQTPYGMSTSNNLIDGMTYTLDNRRLYAYQQAGRDNIPIAFVGWDVAKREAFKFSTKDGGATAVLE